MEAVKVPTAVIVKLPFDPPDHLNFPYSVAAAAVVGDHVGIQSVVNDVGKVNVNICVFADGVVPDVNSK